MPRRLAIALSALLDWEEKAVHVVGEIPASLPELGLPDIALGDLHPQMYPYYYYYGDAMLSLFENTKGQDLFGDAVRTDPPDDSWPNCRTTTSATS